MESKNLKPRILDALDVIGRPATAREIAAVGAIDERIHSRLKEMEAAGDIVRFQAVGQPILYAPPTMAYEEPPAGNTKPPQDVRQETPPMENTTTPPKTVTTTRFSGIYETLQDQQQQLNAAIAKYIHSLLDGDPIYQAMTDARLKLQDAINEMDSRHTALHPKSANVGTRND